MVRIERGPELFLLVSPLIGVEQATCDAYFEWVEKRILAPISDSFPAVFDKLMAFHKSQIAELAGMPFESGEKVD